MIRFALFFILLSLAFPAMAQPQVPSRRLAGEITTAPICGKLVNRSDQTIMGTIATMPQRLQDGTMAAHEDNFRLAAGEEKEICARGPFFEGQKLELTLRTLFPLFSCYTQINGNVYLDAQRDKEGVNHLSAVCR